MAHSTFTKQKDGTGGSVSLQKCPKRAEAQWLTRTCGVAWDLLIEGRSFSTENDEVMSESNAWLQQDV